MTATDSNVHPIGISVAVWLAVIIGLSGLTLLVFLILKRNLIPSKRLIPLWVLAFCLLIGSLFTLLLPTPEVVLKVSSGEADDDGSTPLGTR